jgi:hypothetical protein
MDTLNIAKEILFKEGYGFTDRVIQDCALMLALSKIEQYRSECDFFEHKYSMKLEQFGYVLRQTKGEENFEKEEDLDDWEFAFNALKWWEQKAGLPNNMLKFHFSTPDETIRII